MSVDPYYGFYSSGTYTRPAVASTTATTTSTVTGGGTSDTTSNNLASQLASTQKTVQTQAAPGVTVAIHRSATGEITVENVQTGKSFTTSGIDISTPKGQQQLAAIEKVASIGGSAADYQAAMMGLNYTPAFATPSPYRVTAATQPTGYTLRQPDSPMLQQAKAIAASPGGVYGYSYYYGFEGKSATGQPMSFGVGGVGNAFADKQAKQQQQIALQNLLSANSGQVSRNPNFNLIPTPQTSFEQYKFNQLRPNDQYGLGFTKGWTSGGYDTSDPFASTVAPIALAGLKFGGFFIDTPVELFRNPQRAISYTLEGMKPTSQIAAAIESPIEFGTSAFLWGKTFGKATETYAEFMREPSRGSAVTTLTGREYSSQAEIFLKTTENGDVVVVSDTKAQVSLTKIEPQVGRIVKGIYYEGPFTEVGEMKGTSNFRVIEKSASGNKIIGTGSEPFTSRILLTPELKVTLPSLRLPLFQEMNIGASSVKVASEGLLFSAKKGDLKVVSTIKFGSKFGGNDIMEFRGLGAEYGTGKTTDYYIYTREQYQLGRTGKDIGTQFAQTQTALRPATGKLNEFAYQFGLRQPVRINELVAISEEPHGIRQIYGKPVSSLSQVLTTDVAAYPPTYLAKVIKSASVFTKTGSTAEIPNIMRGIAFAGEAPILGYSKTSATSKLIQTPQYATAETTQYKMSKATSLGFDFTGVAGTLFKRDFGAKLSSDLGTKLSVSFGSRFNQPLTSGLETKYSSKISQSLLSKPASELQTKLDTKIETKLTDQLGQQLTQQLSEPLATKLTNTLGTKLTSQFTEKMNTELITSPAYGFKPTPKYPILTETKRGSSGYSFFGSTKGYRVFLKRRGKFKPVSEPVPKASALSIGIKAASSTLGRTFMIKPAGYVPENKPQGYSNLNKLEEFYKKGPATYIQKTMFAISSLGEKREIKQSKGRKRLFGWF